MAENTTIRGIARYVAGIRPDVAPSHLAAVARALLDTVAVAVAAEREAASAIAADYADRSCRAGRARVWASGRPLAAEGAAFVNGVMGHVLDYDDVTPPMRGHPSIAILPALTAVAEEREADCATFCAAYVAGFEVLCKLARSGVQHQYEVGWHSTAALGVIAATAACAALEGMDEETATTAIALAVGQASGTRENFGAMSKSLQVGFASAAAVRSVRLAALGASASDSALDGSSGYLRLFGLDGGEPDAVSGLGEPPVELERSGIGVKLFPSCYSTHAAIEATGRLAARHDLRSAQIRSIDVMINRTGTLPLIDTRPGDGLEAKFSLPYVVASMLVDRTVGLGSFEPGQLARPDVIGVMDSVVVGEDDGPPTPRRARVRIGLAEGMSVEETVTAVAGSPDRPVSDDQLQRKVHDCFAHVRTDASPPDVAAFVASLPGSGVGEALDAATGRTRELSGGGIGEEAALRGRH